MISSALVMAVSMFALAINVRYLESFPSSSSSSSSNSSSSSTTFDDDGLGKPAHFLTVLPLLEIIVYMLSYGAGLGTVPWILLGELCPAKVKGVASGVTVFVAFLTIFAIVKLFPFALASVGTSWTYGAFGAVSVVTAVFVWALVPETGTKTLAEVEAIFDK